MTVQPFNQYKNNVLSKIPERHHFGFLSYTADKTSRASIEAMARHFGYRTSPKEKAMLFRRCNEPIVVVSQNTSEMSLGPCGFQGAYGYRIDIIKQALERCLIPKSAGPGKPNPEDVANDLQRGPTFAEVFPDKLWTYFAEQVETNGGYVQNLEKLRELLNKVGPFNAFYFIKNAFPPLMRFDLPIRRAAKENWDAPIIDSSGLVSTPKALIDWLMSHDALQHTENPAELIKKWKTTEPKELAIAQNALEKTFGKTVTEAELMDSLTGEGQVFWWCLAELLNLKIAENAKLLDDINYMKCKFNRTLGDPAFRARILEYRYNQFGVDLVCTQECTSLLFDEQMIEGGFYSTDVFSKDGSKIYLHSSKFDEAHEVIPLLYKDQVGSRDNTGTATAVIATVKNTSQNVFIASCHGSPKDPEDIIRQINSILQEYINRRREDPYLMLIISMDTNTSNEEEEEALLKLLNNIFNMTNSGPTTVKTRALSCQFSKVFNPISRRKSYIAVPKKQGLSYQTIAFSQNPEDWMKPGPNIDEPLDHKALAACVTFNDTRPALKTLGAYAQALRV